MLFHLAQHLLYTKWRDPGEEPKLHLFGQLKRIATQWLDDGYLVCNGGTYPAQLIYQELADMACERITAAITETLVGRAPDQGHPRPLQPDRLHRARQLHHLEDRPLGNRCPQVPHQLGHAATAIGRPSSAASPKRIPASAPTSRTRTSASKSPTAMGRHAAQIPARLHRPGRRRPRRTTTCCNLIVEIKGYRGEDAKEKANTMDTYWVPGVNNLGKFGRWAFAEFTSVFEIDADFAKLIQSFATPGEAGST